MGDKYIGTCGESVDEVEGETTRILTCAKRPGISTTTWIEDTTRQEAISEFCRRCPRLRPDRHVFFIDLVLMDADLGEGLHTQIDEHVLYKILDFDEAMETFKNLKKLPTVNQIREKMKELAGKALILPNEIEKGEEDAWRGFCQGGISACRWLLGEADGDPGHELDYIDKKDPEQ